MMNIKNRFMGLTLFVLTLTPAFSGAQNIGPGSPFCVPQKEAIINLHPAYFGVPTIWDATFADRDGMMEFADALALENGNVLALGEKLDPDFRPHEKVLVEINSRARAVADARMPAQQGERSSAILPTDQGYIISSTVSSGKENADKHVRLVWVDAERAFKRDMVLKDAAFNYTSMGLSDAVNGGFLAVIHAVKRNDESEQHGIIMHISDSGKVLWKRAYLPGIPNQVYGVSMTSDKDYVVGGYIRNEDGRMAGWLLKLNEDGTIIWQKTYPRGDYAVFRHGYTKPYDMTGDHYVVTGQIMPNNAQPGATWVMEVDSIGEIVWQRYIRATGYDLDGRAIRAYGDGRISVLANAKATKDDGSDHIRLFTMSPRGGLMEDESYMEGERARATSFVTGWNGERIVTAVIETSDQVEKDAHKVELITEALIREEQEKARAGQKNQQGPPVPTPEQIDEITASLPAAQIRSEGWLFVATGLEPYTDPCLVVRPTPAQ